MTQSRHGSSGVTRRSLLRIGGAGLLGALAGCDVLATDPAGEDSGDRAARKGKEAPRFADLVKAGDLPPLKERLPAKPLVIEPAERVGVYGGDMRTMVVGLTDTAWIGATIDDENLVAWDPEFSGDVWPNLAETFEATDDGTVFTFNLRRGVRWSDGTEFTAADIVFAYEDVLSNREITPVHPAWLCAGGTGGKPPAELEKVDDYTFRFTFAEPNGLFLQHLVVQGELVKYPRHHFEQFHLTYTPDVEELAEEEGFATWVELFTNRAEKWQRVGVPVLTPWVTDQPLGEGAGARFVVVRNPYYWKTDPDGSQLPYLDRVVFDVVGDQELMVIKITNGEVDMHSRHVMSSRNKPIFADSREQSDYDFFEVRTTDFNEMGIYLNLSHPDPALREVFGAKEFRMALSHAINRQEIIDAVFQRQGEPWQIGPRPESPFYDEQLAQQYVEYDPDLANQLLDDAGFVDRDDDGIRLRKDGQPIAFTIEISVPSLNEAWVPATELVRDYWLEVGVDARIKPEDRSLFFERVFSNQHDATSYVGEFGDYDALLWPDAFVPTRIFAMYGVGWGIWYSSGGADGVEPPPAVQEQLRLFDRVKLTIDETEREELFREAMAITRDQFYAIGTSLPPQYYGIVKNTFHNVPDGVAGTILEAPAVGQPEQFFTTV